MPRFTITDVIAIAAAVVAVLVLFIAPVAVVPRFAELYADFGESETVAWSLALAQWITPLLSVPMLFMIAMALRSRDVVRRRVLLASTVILGALAVIALFALLYYPLYAIAGTISAE